MNIIVTIKQVPDTNNITIDPETGALKREGVPSIVNPEDRNAVEAALSLKDEHGGKVVALSMGPPQAEAALREVLSMGVDDAVLLCDKALAGADTHATAYALARAIKKMGKYDLIICGRQAIDGDTAQTGPQLSEFLKVPQITYVNDFKIGEGRIRAKSAFGHMIRTVEAKLPALITITKDANVPRYPTIRKILWAYREKDVTVWTSGDIDANPVRIGLAGSPTQVRSTFWPEHKRTGKVFTGTVDELAGKLHDVLIGCKFI